MFELTILTIDGKKYTESIPRISLPTSDGIRTILANHMDIVVPVDIGIVRLIRPNEQEDVVVSQGIFYFSDNDAHLFVRTFEFASEIDEERARRAKERAESKLQDQLTSRELAKAQSALQRAITRISASNYG
jgi:F-type H+-transporting ATPase subunit epsilon